MGTKLEDSGTDMRPARVIVVDDHRLTRELLAAAMGAHPALEVVGVAVDGEEAVSLTGALEPDVVVMDVRMPRLDGLAATRQIRANTHAAVVLISSYEDPSYAAAAVAAGASAFLSKSRSEGDLLAAVLDAAHQAR